MSDETKTVDANAPVVERNGQSMTLVKQTFGKKAKLAGKEFYAPETSANRFQDDAAWYGLDWLVAVTNKTARNIFADLYTDNIDEKTGEFNQEQWAMDAADFTAGVAKLADLQDDYEELVGLQQQYALNPAFGEDSEEGKQLSASITEVANKIKPIRAAIAAIKVKYADRAEKRKQKEASSTTAQPAAEAVTA